MTLTNNRNKMISERRKKHNRRQAAKFCITVLPVILYMVLLAWGTWEISKSMQSVNKVFEDTVVALNELSQSLDELESSLETLSSELDPMQQDIENIMIELNEISTQLGIDQSEQESTEPTEPETEMPTTSTTTPEVGITEKIDTEIVQSSGTVDLAKKYEYVMYDWQGPSDVTIDLVEYGYNLMVSKNMNPDILFAVIEVESQGHANNVNSSSGASGLGQFMKGTGRYIYEDVLKLGTYDHSTTPLDPKVNIQMMVTYLEILHNQKDGNVKEMMRSYSGAGSNNDALDRYYQKLIDVLGYAP